MRIGIDANLASPLYGGLGIYAETIIKELLIFLSKRR
jgi:hypothetical protein